MKRCIPILLAVVSAILFVSTLGLWVASFWTDDLYHNFSSAHRKGISLAAFDIDRGAVRAYVVAPWPATFTPAEIRAGRLKPTGAPDVAIPPDLPPGVSRQDMLPMVIGSTQNDPMPGIHIDGQTIFTRSGSAKVAIAWNVFISCWLLLAVTGALPVAFAVQQVRLGIQRRRRLRAGQCRHCGYDLRGTPDRCPECGFAPAAS